MFGMIVIMIEVLGWIQDIIYELFFGKCKTLTWTEDLDQSERFGDTAGLRNGLVSKASIQYCKNFIHASVLTGDRKMVSFQVFLLQSEHCATT